MTTIVQKSLLGLSVLMAIVFVAVLTSKKFTLESRRNTLLLEMVANISTDLDKLDSGFDAIVSRTEAAKGQLRRLAALHRDNLMICALLHEKHAKKQQITEKTDQYDTNIGERACGPCGPGYPTPRMAMTQGAREEILYVVCIQPDPERPDVLSTVDVDPSSSTYRQMIHNLRMPVAGDELHHSGWNICSSCHDSRKKRDTLVLPCLGSDRIYFVDVSEERKPKIEKQTVELEELHKLDLATPQTSHCSPTGEIIVSTIGKPNGDALGSFIATDSDTLETKGVWTKDETAFGYDFWYQPHHDVLVASEWGAPRLITSGFSPSGQWDAEKVIDIPSKKVEGWESPEIHGMVTDILVSLDDKYLYLSNWLHGDVRQYDITDRRHPVLKGQVFLGGSVLSDGKIRVLEDKELDKQPDPVFVKGRRLHGAPQMLQLSLDGRRLYVTSSLFSVWDKQFYPELVKNGSTMVKLDIDVDNGGMTLDEKFLVDFGADRDEILLAHEMRYPGGDCTSDIWLP